MKLNERGKHIAICPCPDMVGESEAWFVIQDNGFYSVTLAIYAYEENAFEYGRETACDLDLPLYVWNKLTHSYIKIH